MPKKLISNKQPSVIPEALRNFDPATLWPNSFLPRDPTAVRWATGGLATGFKSKSARQMRSQAVSTDHKEGLFTAARNRLGRRESARYWSSRTFAKSFDIRPDSLRKMLSESGHVYGIRPVKLPSGRNLWSVIEIEALLVRCANGGLGEGESQ
jgi:hypothetical protein